ncbi:MAG TPA: RidA family protein [Pseudonocardia sp.]|jgi:2-iminobutanoate/2-iminopropanoate deaminase|nr:RidA family protein [Pseudonocardia sp.]
MPRKAFDPPDVRPPGGPYSSAVRCGPWVLTAGQCGYRPDGSLPTELDGQVAQAFRNLLAVLEAGGATADDVQVVTVHLADAADFDRMNARYREYFSEPYPARTTVTAGLRPGVRFEITAQAYVA